MPWSPLSVGTEGLAAAASERETEIETETGSDWLLLRFTCAPALCLREPDAWFSLSSPPAPTVSREGSSQKTLNKLLEAAAREAETLF